MRCYRVKVGDVTAIVSVAGAPPRHQQCHNCHRTATRLCDWKMGGGRTCDKPICPTPACGASPADGKDLCAHHTKAWNERKPKAAAPVESPTEPGQKPLL